MGRILLRLWCHSHRCRLGRYCSSLLHYSRSGIGQCIGQSNLRLLIPTLAWYFREQPLCFGRDARLQETPDDQVKSTDRLKLRLQVDLVLHHCWNYSTSKLRQIGNRSQWHLPLATHRQTHVHWNCSVRISNTDKFSQSNCSQLWSCFEIL